MRPPSENPGFSPALPLLSPLPWLLCSARALQPVAACAPQWCRAWPPAFPQPLPGMAPGSGVGGHGALCRPRGGCGGPCRGRGGCGCPCRGCGAMVVPAGSGGMRGWALLGDMGPVGLVNEHLELWYKAEPVPFSTFTQMAACTKHSLFGAGKQLFSCFFFSPPLPTLSPVLKRCCHHRTSAARSCSEVQGQSRGFPSSPARSRCYLLRRFWKRGSWGGEQLSSKKSEA